MLIRPYDISDSDQVKALVVSHLGPSSETLVGLFEPAYVAEKDGQIVGYVSATVKHGDHAQGRNFVVAKSVRGRHTLKRLVAALEDDLMQRGIWRYRGRLRREDAYFLRIAAGWGGRIVGTDDEDYIVEVPILGRARAKRRWKGEDVHATVG